MKVALIRDILFTRHVIGGELIDNYIIAGWTDNHLFHKHIGGRILCGNIKSRICIRLKYALESLITCPGPLRLEKKIKYKMEQSHPPPNYEASAGETNLQVSNTLPPDVVQCLKNARFVRSVPLIIHLATLLINTPASPRNLYQPPPACLPHELHLPPLHPLHSLPNNNNDH